VAFLEKRQTGTLFRPLQRAGDDFFLLEIFSASFLAIKLISSSIGSDVKWLKLAHGVLKVAKGGVFGETSNGDPVPPPAEGR
jgi:hypothetical protein